MSKKNEPTGRLDRTTPVPNFLLDGWMPFLSSAELRVVLYVLRRTRGFQKEWDQLSMEQMVSGIVRGNGKRLDRGTGLSERACREAIRSLIRRGALRREEAVTANGASDTPWYSLDPSCSPTTDSENGAVGEKGVAESARGRVADSARGEGGKSCQGGRVADSASHKRKNSPVSPRLWDDGVGGVSPPVPSGKERVGERKATPPSSSCPEGGRDPGENTNPSDDDGQKSNPKNSDQGRDDGSRVGGEARSRAARGSWQELADDIRAVPEEELTEDARELGEKLREKVPRLEAARATRLALYCIETETVAHLGAVVAGAEKKLKYEVENTWSYLIKILCPFPEASGNGKLSRESFGNAYEAAQPARTLRGVGRRHQFEAVENTQPRNLDDYFHPFITDDGSSEEAAAEAFEAAHGAARPARTLGGKPAATGSRASRTSAPARPRTTSKGSRRTGATGGNPPHIFVEGCCAMRNTPPAALLGKGVGAAG